jgi:uncharacterized repeat protein (TIGR01451 family)
MKQFSMSFVITVTTLLILAAAVLAAPPADGPSTPPTQTSDSDWPMLAHDLARSNATPQEVDPGEVPFPGKAVWVRDFASGDGKTAELIFNQYQPIVAGGLVYVGTSRNNMYALDTGTGGIVWTYDGNEPGMIMASPSVVNGILYYAATNGHVYALDASTGVLRWDREVVRLGGFRTSPAVYAGSIYLGAEDGVFYALNTADGTIRWTYNTGAPILNTAAIDVTRGRIYFANEDMVGLALDLNGNLIWKSAKFYGTSTRHFYPVIADGGNAVIFRTSPGPTYRALNGGDTLLARAVGHTVPGDFTGLDDGDYGVNVFAPYNEAGFSAEQNAIVNWLTNQYPEYQTFYVLNVNDGSKRYVTAVLWPGPSGDVGEPPAVAPDGTVYVRTRSYYTNFDGPGTAYIFGAPAATLDLSTGRVRLIQLPGVTQQNSFETGIFAISDESSAISLGGRRLYFYSHGDVLGTMLTSGQDAQRIAATRDMPHGIDGDQRRTALPYGQAGLLNQGMTGPVRSMAGAGGGTSLWSQPAVIADGKVFYVSQGMLGMYQSGFNGETNYIAASPGTQPATGPITVPPAADLERYITEIETYVVGPSAVPDVRNELETQVLDLVSGDRYAPFIQLAGKKPGWIYYNDPTEEAYTLAIAYPYLSPGLQEQVRSHLNNLWAAYPDPFNTSIPYRDLTARRRERYQINNDAGRYAVDRGSAHTIPASNRLYNLWAYAHYLNDWGFLVDRWGSIASVAHSIDPRVIESGKFPYRSINRRVASLIGYARMADHLRAAYPNNPTYQTEYEWAISAATTALRARLQWEEDHRPLGSPWSQDWILEDTAGAGDEVFLKTSWGTGGQIIRYDGLVPSIARALRDYAWDDMQLQNDFVDTVIPAQILAWSFVVNRAELFSNRPHQAREAFLAKALIMEEDPEVLRDYLSYPWCNGDLYYIERLVYIIRGSAVSASKSVNKHSAKQGDTLTYTLRVVGTGDTMNVTDPIPDGTSYVNGSAQRNPALGTLTAGSNQVHWTGTLTAGEVLEITFDVIVEVADPKAIVNRAEIDTGGNVVQLSAPAIANGLKSFLPVVLK